MNIFWNIIELIATFAENLITLEFLVRIFPYKYNGAKKIIPIVFTLILSSAYVTFINKYLNFEGWLGLVVVIIFSAYAAAFLKGKFLYKLLAIIISNSLILIINILTTYILAIIIGIPDTFIFIENDSIRLIALFLTKFIYFFVTRFFVKIFKKENFELKNFEFILMAIMFILTFSIAIALVKIQMDSVNEDLLILISVFCIVITNIFIFYIMKKISKENKNNLKISLLELQLSEQKAMIQDAGHIGQEIKKAEHDLKHHLLSVLGIIKNNNPKEAEIYLQQLLGEYETSIFKYITIDNSAINSILNFKIGRCHANNIDIKLEIESDFSGFNDIDICVLLSNLLDNAIEASASVSNPQITVTIKNDKNYLCILVRNKINKSVLKENKLLNTTKIDKDRHGFGLYSVSQIVDKYDGMKSFYEKNNYFVSDIWLKKDVYNLVDRIKSELELQVRQN